MTLAAKTRRTCVGCAQSDAPEAMVRVVLAPAEIGGVEVDPASFGGRPKAGRGAHVHPRMRCVQGAVKRGFSRSFRREVRGEARALASKICDVADARLRDLVSGANRGGLVNSMKQNGSPVTLVAAGTDASSFMGAPHPAGSLMLPMSASALGALFGRDKVLAFTVESGPASRGLARVCAIEPAMRAARAAEDG